MTSEDIEDRFWKSLKSDRTVMIGTKSAPPRPMTGLLLPDADRGPLWLFTTVDSELLENLNPSADAIATFVSKGHDTFATVTGTLTKSETREVIDKLWNPFVAAWFEGGKEDPKLALLRFEMDSAEIWTDASSLIAGAKILMGIDPKADYREKVANVTF